MPALPAGAAAASGGPAGISELPAVTAGLRSLSGCHRSNSHAVGNCCGHNLTQQHIMTECCEGPNGCRPWQMDCRQHDDCTAGREPAPIRATAVREHLLGCGDGLAAAAAPPGCVWPLSRDEPLAAFGPWPCCCCCCCVCCWTCHRSISTCGDARGPDGRTGASCAR